MITRDKLIAKGWSKEEIDKTMDIMDRAKKHPHPHTHYVNLSVYWIALVIIFIGNIAFSLLLLPLILTLNGMTLFFIILLLGFVFGILMSIIINDIENLERKHHLLIFFLFPIFALINFIIVVNIANKNIVAELTGLHQNPWIIGLIYIVSFMLPYIYLVFNEKWS